MGDPVGSESERRDLTWQFRKLVDRHDGWTVFYQVRPGNLHLYLDLGLSLLKLGEEARVPLVDFSLDGAERITGVPLVLRPSDPMAFGFKVGDFGYIFLSPRSLNIMCKYTSKSSA